MMIKNWAWRCYFFFSVPKKSFHFFALHLKEYMPVAFQTKMSSTCPSLGVAGRGSYIQNNLPQVGTQGCKFKRHWISHQSWDFSPNFAQTDVVYKYLDQLNEEVTEEGTCLQEITCACHPSLCVSVLRWNWVRLVKWVAALILSVQLRKLSSFFFLFLLLGTQIFLRLHCVFTITTLGYRSVLTQCNSVQCAKNAYTLWCSQSKLLHCAFKKKTVGLDSNKWISSL